MATIADLNVVISATIDDFEAKMAKVESGIGRAGEYAKSAGQALTIGVTAPLTLLAGAAIKTAADMEALRTGFAATYKGAEPLSVALGRVQELAKLPGLGLREALQGATNLQAAGFSAEQAAKSLSAFGNALATVGKGKAELDSVSLALTQINNTPFVQGQDLNQLRQALPQIGEAMKKAFGVTNAEGLKAIGITSKQFIEGITAEFDKLPKVTGGLKNALENLSDAGTLALSKLGDALSKSFNLSGLSDTISTAVKSMADSFAALSPAVQKAIFIFAGLVAAAGPVLLAIGAIGAAIPAVVAGLALLSGPIGIAVAVIAALTVATVAYAASGTSATAEFKSQQQAVTALSDSVNPLLTRYDELKAKSTLTKAEQEELRSIIQKVGEQIPTSITAFDSYGKAMDINSVAARNFVKTQQEILAVKNRDALTEQREEYTRLTGQIQNAQNALKSFNAQGVLVKFVASGDDLGGDTFALTAKEITELQAKLEGLREARRGVGGLIDELKGIRPAVADANAAGPVKPPVDEKASKVLADISKALRDNENAARALGDNYDYVGGKVSILTSGVKKLTDLGFAPGGAVVQRYAALLNQLPTALDRALGSIKGAVAQLGVALQVPMLNVPEQGLKTTLKPLVFPPLDNSKFKKTLTDTEEIMRDFNKRGENILGAGLATIASTFFKGIGQLATGSITAEQFGGGLLAVIGQVCTQLGEAAIGIGVSMLAIKFSFSNPYTAIAAGAALLILGAALGSIANDALSVSPGGGAGGGSSPGGASIASAPRSNFTPTTAPGAADGGRPPAVNIHDVKFVLQGSELVGAIKIQTDRLGRVVGR